MADVGSPGPGAAARAALARRVAARLSARTGMPWTARPLAARESGTVLLAPRSGQLALPEAWALARALARTGGVAACEPALTTSGLEPPPELRSRLAPGPAAAARSLGRERPRACSEPDDWHLSFAAVPQAWRRFAATGREPGEGVIVGHPDTGYTRHPTLWSDGPSARRVLVALGHDFVDDDADAADSGRGPRAGHGTSTAGVIAGDGGQRAGGHAVPGVAPGARVMPLRVGDDVVHWFSYPRVVEAIHHAIDHGAHVISMSLGGPLASQPLAEALARAVRHGVIPVAAAGNVYPHVVYPGKYSTTICVAAVHCGGGLWRWTAEGNAVDLAAPGESVWVPRARDGRYTFARSSGTSHATAMTAGAAALWLSFHGRDALLARYGPAGLVAAFRDALTRRGVATPPAWRSDRAGSGMLDVERLLAAALPERRAARTRAAGDVPRLAALAAYVPELSAARVRGGLLAMFDARPRELDRVLERFGDELAFHLAFDPEVRAALRAAAGGAGARAASVPRRARARLRLAGAALARDGSRELRAALSAV